MQVPPHCPLVRNRGLPTPCCLSAPTTGCPESSLSHFMHCLSHASLQGNPQPASRPARGGGEHISFLFLDDKLAERSGSFPGQRFCCPRGPWAPWALQEAREAAQAQGGALPLGHERKNGGESLIQASSGMFKGRERLTCPTHILGFVGLPFLQQGNRGHKGNLHPELQNPQKQLLGLQVSRWDRPSRPLGLAWRKVALPQTKSKGWTFLVLWRLLRAQLYTPLQIHVPCVP